MLMFIETKWAEEAVIVSVISYAVFYGGFGQMVAGVFEVGTAGTADRPTNTHHAWPISRPPCCLAAHCSSVCSGKVVFV